MQFAHAFTELAAILFAAAALGALGTWLRQPLIVSFIGVGILVGPAGLGIVTHNEEVELLASMGIALLLFVVGLKLDVQMIRTMGPVALSTGLGQVIFTSVVGYFIAIALGYPAIEATYIAVALTFSSTIIIVKLLSDKREIDALHGRIAVGFLIVQDIVVILAMIALTAIGSGQGEEADLPRAAAMVVVKGVGFLAVVVALMRWVLPPVTRVLARSAELLVISAIAWAVALAAAGELVGFSREVGAFLAGVSLAATPYREAIGGRLVTVRDFLLLFFFIDLGARLDLSLLGATVVPSLIFSAFVLIGNPLIVMIIMGAMGYRKRTGFLAGLTVAQISEFSLILGALGMSLGHIDQETMGLITFVGLVTIGLSTYMILYSAPLYERLAPLLGAFERRTPYREPGGGDQRKKPKADVILFGLGRYGSGIAAHLRRRHRRVVGVDFDPAVLERWRASGLPVLYGDAEDPELFEHLPLADARWVVNATPDLETARMLMRHLEDHGYTGKVAVACRTPDDARLLEQEGADLVLRPFADAAEQAADALTSAMDQIVAAAPEAIGLKEVRLTAASPWAGQTIAEIPLRERFNVSVLAVSRSGRSVLNPDPAFQLFPADRLVLSGEPDDLARATEFLSLEVYGDEDAPDFAIEEWSLADAPDWHGRTLADLHLRSRFGITVVAIRRAGAPVETPAARSRLGPDDRVVVAGRREALARARPSQLRGTAT
jgi:Kef-type K+ transport system membrane component KefB/Trk K+ transport system NAD-binding subunit